jgi:biotin carboxylase
MIGKLICYGENRDVAIARMKNAAGADHRRYQNQR